MMWADLFVAAGLLAMFAMGFWLGHTGAAEPEPPAVAGDLDQMRAVDDPPWEWR